MPWLLLSGPGNVPPGPQLGAWHAAGTVSSPSPRCRSEKGGREWILGRPGRGLLGSTPFVFLHHYLYFKTSYFCLV